jgi:hypothetical protein
MWGKNIPQKCSRSAKHVSDTIFIQDRGGSGMANVWQFPLQTAKWLEKKRIFFWTRRIDSPTAIFSVAALKTDLFFEFHAKNRTLLHTILNRALFEALMPKYGRLSSEKICYCTLLGGGSRGWSTLTTGLPTEYQYWPFAGMHRKNGIHRRMMNSIYPFLPRSILHSVDVWYYQKRCIVQNRLFPVRYTITRLIRDLPANREY